MKQTVSKSDFIDAFKDYNREDNFSYDGLCALYDFLEDFGEDTGREVDLDVIALCCEFSEYGSALEACENYSFEPDPEEDEDDQEDAALGWLRDQTIVIEFPGGIIIQDF